MCIYFPSLIAQTRARRALHDVTIFYDEQILNANSQRTISTSRITRQKRNVKVTDFGLSKLGNKINTQSDVRVVQEGHKEINEDGEELDDEENGEGESKAPATSVKAEIGTLSWAAPEVIKGEAASPTSDVYSFGVILFELLTRQIPFKDSPQESVPFLVTDEGKRPADMVDMTTFELPLEVSPVQDLMRDCCSADPLDRPEISQVTTRLNEIAANVAQAADWRRVVERPEEGNGGKGGEKVCFFITESLPLPLFRPCN